ITARPPHANRGSRRYGARPRRTATGALVGPASQAATKTTIPYASVATAAWFSNDVSIVQAALTAELTDSVLASELTTASPASVRATSTAAPANASPSPVARSAS